MADNIIKCLLVSDFTLDNLSGILANDANLPLMDARSAPFDQVIPTLLDKSLPCWKPNPECVIIWTKPERIIKSYQKVMEYEKIAIKDLLEEVDKFASLIHGIAGQHKIILIPSWTIPTFHRGLGLTNMNPVSGLENILMQMNLRLSEMLSSAPNIFMLNTQRWIFQAGKFACNPKLWYMGKIPFNNTVFQEAAADIKAALRGILGQSRKMIITDLDDTLWGGIVGEGGYQNLILGGHDPVGEAYVDYQLALKSMIKRGVLLGIVSKNNESTALEAINKHPEMKIALDDFVGWKINWHDKAQNICELADELNLGLQSIVFIDDNPVERDRVRAALPEIFVPDWPDDPMLSASSLLSLNCFDKPVHTDEDADRTKMYNAEHKRKNLKHTLISIEDWLKSLEIITQVESLNKINLERTTQLLNKTNQMNLTTRRLTETELLKWAELKQNRLWVLRVADKFGDSGLTGIVSCEIKYQEAQIVDFILSCRVMGRKIEETMLHIITDFAQSQGLIKVTAIPVKTEKNKPCLDFFDKSGFIFDSNDNSYTWLLNKTYPLPDCITLQSK